MRSEDVLSRPLSLPRKAALASEIIGLYARVRWRLSQRQLPEVLAALRSVAIQEQVPQHHPGMPYRLAWAVERVLGRLPADSRCLIRSLVLVGLLARRSIPATLVIGVRPGGSDFAAHAWVERAGRALLAEGGEEFQRLTEL